jgi:hypothetical protein
VRRASERRNIGSEVLAVLEVSRLMRSSQRVWKKSASLNRGGVVHLVWNMVRIVKGKKTSRGFWPRKKEARPDKARLQCLWFDSHNEGKSLVLVPVAIWGVERHDRLKLWTTCLENEGSQNYCSLLIIDKGLRRLLT